MSVNELGLPGLRYALYKSEEDGYAIVRVLDVPNNSHDGATRDPSRHAIRNMNPDTPLHLCDPSKLITQHRLGDHTLPYRTIDPAMYDKYEIDWYETGILPPPMYACFVVARKCYLCGDMQASSDDIHGESTENFKEGYRFCTACLPYFRRALYKTLAPIWRLRLESERNRRTPIWVHRTRRDESGKSDRTNSGRPFRYTKWFVSSWISYKSMNRHDPNNVFEEDLICVEEWISDTESNAEPMSKVVSVMDVFFANRGSFTDPDYDPNVDDPLNQIRHMSLDEKREIMQRESLPFK
jgi:hypothetical protein